jgi:alpha-galactosidase
MLKIKGNYYILETEHTSILMRNMGGTLEYLYFGEKLSDFEGVDWNGPETLEKEYFPLSVMTQCGGIDFREPSIRVQFENGSNTTDFRLQKGRIAQVTPIDGMPAAYGESKCFKFEFLDATSRLKLTLIYTAFADSDVFTVSASLKNGNGKPVFIQNLASLQLEVWGKDFSFTTFDGDWGSERQKHARPIALGKCENASFGGVSSHNRNPFVLLGRPNETYGVNLVWSGEHRTTAEADETGRTRLVTGINPVSFDYELDPGETFYTPEAVLAYGKDESEVACRMHRFVSRHIVRGKWKNEPRPILVNNWEGTYFDFNREKILGIARKAAEVGAELFVLDDGWFGHRDDDTSSLGDWYDYSDKTGGIVSLAESIRGMGLKFGIWLEPEMISENSDLYRKHPEYCMKSPRREPTRMRNQLMLNLVDPQVQGFVFRTVSRIIATTKASYVKWDFNRKMTDCFDRNTRGGEYKYRYCLGLYSILNKLVDRFPNVLFESCASGGGRFDLGLLCFMPQVWTSDNTDAKDRLMIQAGTACGYPQSTMGAHVSASPNHQTGNRNSLETRFRIACGGLLGYECDLTSLKEEELTQIKEQIAFYKKHRKTLQYGTYYALGDVFKDEIGGFMTVTEDKSEGIAVVAIPNRRTRVFNLRVKFAGLDENATYHVSIRGEKGGLQRVGTASGELLKKGSFHVDGIFQEADQSQNSNPVYTRMFVFESERSKRRRERQSHTEQSEETTSEKVRVRAEKALETTSEDVAE